MDQRHHKTNDPYSSCHVCSSQDCSSTDLSSCLVLITKYKSWNTGVARIFLPATRDRFISLYTSILIVYLTTLYKLCGYLAPMELVTERWYFGGVNLMVTSYQLHVTAMCCKNVFNFKISHLYFLRN